MSEVVETEVAPVEAAAQETMEEERLKAILESLLFAAGEPVPLARLAAVLDNVSRDAIKKALGEMVLGYSGGGRGLVLDEVAGGYQLRTPKEHALYVRKLLAAKPPRLSRPLLETLAIIAYRQPMTRPEIEQLRGVDSGGVLETLLERRLVRIAGRKEAPGRPIMYATTTEFLEVFGLKDLRSLPDLEELKELEGGGVSEGNADEAASFQTERTAEREQSADEPDPAIPRESGAEESPMTASETPGASGDESSPDAPSGEAESSDAVASAGAAAESVQETAAEHATASESNESNEIAGPGGESVASDEVPSSAETSGAESAPGGGSEPERSGGDDR